MIEAHIRESVYKDIYTYLLNHKIITDDADISFDDLKVRTQILYTTERFYTITEVGSVDIHSEDIFPEILFYLVYYKLTHKYELKIYTIDSCTSKNVGDFENLVYIIGYKNDKEILLRTGHVVDNIENENALEAFNVFIDNNGNADMYKAYSLNKFDPTTGDTKIIKFRVYSQKTGKYE